MYPPILKVIGIYLLALTSSAHPNPLALPIYTHHTPTTYLQKRQNNHDLLSPTPLKSFSYTHLIPLTLGTPPQPLLLSLDTGSPHFWVNPTCSLAPSSQYPLCVAAGQYNVSLSETAHPLRMMAKTYGYAPGGGAEAIVSFVEDTVMIGKGLVLEGFRFGVASWSQGLGSGVFGVGPDPDPEIGFRGGDGVLGELVGKEGLRGRVYGVGLLEEGEESGEIVFGGFDRSRFRGGLFRTDVVPPGDAPTNTTRFWVRVNSISHRAPNSNTIIPFDTPQQDYLLDTGTTISFLPPIVVQTLTQAMNGTLNARAGVIEVDCNIDDGAAIFAFGNGDIEVPYRNLVIDTRGMEGFEEEGIGCVLGVAELRGVVGEEVMPVLGLGFMKSVYAVFDLDSVSIHLAQAARCGEPDVVPIGNGTDGVSLAAGNC